MIKDCVILDGKIINIGQWDEQIQAFEVSPAEYDAGGNLVREAVYENRPTNPFPVGATVEQRNFEYHADRGWYEVADPLEEAKNTKIAELKAIEADNLKTFKSSALGTEHTYLSEMNDMLLLNGEYAFVKGDDYDGLPIIWYTIEAGNVEHTKEQFIQVYLDGRANVQNVKYHRASLEAQVAAAATVEEVNAIVW